jgi:hypothetical protein
MYVPIPDIRSDIRNPVLPDIRPEIQYPAFGLARFPPGRIFGKNSILYRYRTSLIFKQARNSFLMLKAFIYMLIRHTYIVLVRLKHVITLLLTM